MPLKSSRGGAVYTGYLAGLASGGSVYVEMRMLDRVIGDKIRKMQRRSQAARMGVSPSRCLNILFGAFSALCRRDAE